MLAQAKEKKKIFFPKLVALLVLFLRQNSWNLCQLHSTYTWGDFSEPVKQLKEKGGKGKRKRKSDKSFNAQ